MFRWSALLIAAAALLLPGTPAVAQAGFGPGFGGARVVASESWVEEWDPAAQRWVRVEDTPSDLRNQPAEQFHTTTTTRAAGAVTVTETIIESSGFTAAPSYGSSFGAGSGQAQFGPFRVLDDKRAALVGATDSASPRAFDALIAAYPGIELIEFHEAPGTTNDLANLAVGRRIRAAGLATFVPAGGSVRSGAVELFLAGTRQSMDRGAVFAVHSWRDEAGREPADFAEEAPENRLYLDYYVEMGMTRAEARAFYRMTNSVPHASALWLDAGQMSHWLAPQQPSPARSRAMARPVWPIAALMAQPLGLFGSEPELAIVPGAAPELAVVPQLAYADLAAVTLVRLDSVHAFP